MSWRTADEVMSCVIPAHMPTTSKLPLKTQGCVRPPTALRPLQSVGEGWRWDEAGGLSTSTTNPKHSVLPENQSALSDLCVCSRVGNCWRGLKPASPLSLPCWHHQGGLPYSRGVQFWSLRGWFACVFSFLTSKPQMKFISYASAWLEWNIWWGKKIPSASLSHSLLVSSGH